MQPCAQCGEQFTPTRRTARFCSAPCRYEWWRLAEVEKQRQRVAEAERVRKPCPVCGTEFQPYTGSVPRKQCSPACTQRAFDARRDADGRYAAMKAAQRGPGSSCVECGDPLRTGARRCRACAGERAHIPGARRLAVYERDLWECQLCGLPVDRCAKHPDPWSASLDHVLPVSLGGDDEESNLQLAHFVCNCRKQDRVGYTA